MGVFKKLKDVLFDVEEEEIPVITKKDNNIKTKFESPKVKEENPIKEIKVPKPELTERELMKTESTFNFPVDFEEKPLTRSKKNFDDYEPVQRTEYEKPKKDFNRDYSNPYHETKRVEPTKPFKPSPIISPVYGILDQNYTKDDVIVKTDIGIKGPDLDAVRRKAYGIENKKKENLKKIDIPDVEDEFTEPLKNLDEILVEKDKETVVIKHTTDIVEDDELPDEPYHDEKVKEPTVEDTLETDLFNLIDSMYNDRKEREGDE